MKTPKKLSGRYYCQETFLLIAAFDKWVELLFCFQVLYWGWKMMDYTFDIMME